MSHEVGKRSEKYVLLSKLSTYYTWKKRKKLDKDNKCKLQESSWDGEFKLLSGSFSASDIQDYLEYIINNYETFTNNWPIQIHIKKLRKWKIELPSKSNRFWHVDL